MSRGAAVHKGDPEPPSDNVLKGQERVQSEKQIEGSLSVTKNVEYEQV